jgi:hypothetical protein
MIIRQFCICTGNFVYRATVASVANTYLHSCVSLGKHRLISVIDQVQKRRIQYSITFHQKKYSITSPIQTRGYIAVTLMAVTTEQKAHRIFEPIRTERITWSWNRYRFMMTPFFLNLTHNSICTYDWFFLKALPSIKVGGEKNTI